MWQLFVTGLEARGFIWGPAVALALGAGFVMLRKPNKLPGTQRVDAMTASARRIVIRARVRACGRRDRDGRLRQGVRQGPHLHACAPVL